MFRVLTATALAALIAGPALAGGSVPAPAPAPVPVPAPVETWDGWYGGLQLEFGEAEAEGYRGRSTIDYEGHMVGVFAGYRVDYGNIVLGGEIDIVTGELEAQSPFSGSIDTIARSGFELGYDFGDALVYGTFGVAGVWLTEAGQGDEEDMGHFWGAGIDYRLSGMMDRDIIVGAEILHHNIDDFEGLSGADFSATTFGISVGLEF